MSAPTMHRADGHVTEDLPPLGTTGSVSVDPSAGRDRDSRNAGIGEAVAAGMIFLGALLPWVSLDFLGASTPGVRTTEGKVALGLAVVAGLFAFLAIVGRESRALFHLGAAAAGLCGLVAAAVLGFRFDYLVNDLAQMGMGRTMIRNSLGLSAGWYLSLIACLAVITFGLWGFLRSRR